MNEDRFALLSAYLDQELDPTEVTEVEALLAHDPEARAVLDELRADQALLRDQLQERPASEAMLANNRRRILSRLPEPEEHANPGWLEGLRQLFTPRRVLGLGLPVALAALVLLRPPRPMGPPRPPALSPPSGLVARRFAESPAVRVLEVTTEDVTAIATSLHLDEVDVDVVWVMN